MIRDSQNSKVLGGILYFHDNKGLPKIVLVSI